MRTPTVFTPSHSGRLEGNDAHVDAIARGRGGVRTPGWRDREQEVAQGADSYRKIACVSKGMGGVRGSWEIMLLGMRARDGVCGCVFEQKRPRGAGAAGGLASGGLQVRAIETHLLVGCCFENGFCSAFVRRFLNGFPNYIFGL